MSWPTLSAWSTSKKVLPPIVSSAVSVLPPFLVGSLAIEIRRDLHFSVSDFGLAVAAFYFSAAVGSAPLGKLADAIGALRAMRIGCSWMSLVLFAIGWLVTSWPALVAGLAAAGLASAILSPAANQFLAESVPSVRQGLAFGLKQAAIPVALLVAGAAVPIVDAGGGWRRTFFAVGVWAAATAFFLPRREVRAESPSVNAPALFSRRALGGLSVLGVGFGFAVGASSALSSFTVSASVSMGWSSGTAGVLVASGACAAALARIAVGIVADRGRYQIFHIVSVLLFLGAFGYVAIGVSAYGVRALLIPALLFTFPTGWGWNGLFNLGVVANFPRGAARATGLTGTGGRVGGFLGPAIFGLVVTRYSYGTAWMAAALFALMGGLIIVQGAHVLASHSG